MAAVVWKYKLEWAASGWQSILMPRFHKVLSCGFQGADLMVWALVDPEIGLTHQQFIILETGERSEALEAIPLSDGMPIAVVSGPEYVGTVVSKSGTVGHVFKRGEI